ncbi:MAG: vWA domain-containing protein [Candidatus Thorarchaeota archaeon]|jgi:hypothetical protein
MASKRVDDGTTGTPVVDKKDVIFDQSGSMNCVRDQSLSSLNEFLGNQRRNATVGSCFTLVLFDTDAKSNPRIVTTRDKVSLADVKDLTREEYVPDGMTPMYDAIGTTINKYKNDDSFEYVIVILTDGEENSSKEYNNVKVTALIKDRTAAGWAFVYLGANQDAFAVGGKMGIAHNVNYGYGNMKRQMANVSHGVSAYQQCKSAGLAIFRSVSEQSAVPQQPQQSPYMARMSTAPVHPVRKKKSTKLPPPLSQRQQ